MGLTNEDLLDGLDDPGRSRLGDQPDEAGEHQPVHLMKEESLADVTIEARGLQCPMPVIKLSQAIMSAGPARELISTDRGSCSDVPAWAADMGDELEEQFETDGGFHFVIQKS